MIRGVTEIKGLRETRTMQGSKKRSMPRVKRSAYLDLFILGKEESRLEKEMSVIEKRKESLQKKLGEIAVELKKLEEAKNREKRAAPGESDPQRPKDWKKMAMTY
jgi:predicted  nucleic acid-binding Zn-ribbon protein